MIRILKNISKAPVETTSHGKSYSIKPKGTLTINDSQANEIAADLLSRYSFLQDATPKKEVEVETVEVTEKNHKGKNVKKSKKVVRRAEGVRKI